MPIYEYRCEMCDTVFERLVKISSDEKILCPECGSPRVKKLMSVCSFNSDSGRSSAGSSCDGCSASSCATCGR